MNIAICDDNLHDTQQISVLLTQYMTKNNFDAEIHTFTCGEELEKSFKKHPYDVVFLDIYMAGMNGIKTAERLREIDVEFSLIFITTSKDYALESFSFGANDYIVKPIKQTEIDRAFSKCRSVFLKNARFINVMSERMELKIPISKILYVETYGRETFFHTGERKIRSTAPLLLDNLEKMLGNNFLRCHRSYIVNLVYVVKIEGEDFLMRDGSTVPLRQRGRSKLREAYANFISAQLFEVLL